MLKASGFLFSFEAESIQLLYCGNKFTYYTKYHISFLYIGTFVHLWELCDPSDDNIRICQPLLKLNERYSRPKLFFALTVPTPNAYNQSSTIS